MSGIDVLGVKVAPSFTEKMTFAEPDRIEFRHDPPAGDEGEGRASRAGTSSPRRRTASGTSLVTELEITLDLPLPKAAGRAVRADDAKVIDTMGDRFSANLLDHLGARRERLRRCTCP